MIELSLPRKPKDNIFKGFIIGLVILLVAVGFALPYIKRKKESGDERVPENEGIETKARRRAVLKSIAELDDLYESDKIDTEAYHSERKELMEKAKELSKYSGG